MLAIRRGGGGEEAAGGVDVLEQSHIVLLRVGEARGQV
jgi:hypothetical protein